jgi:hypothetical protein
MIRRTVESAPSQPMSMLPVSEVPSGNVAFTESSATLISVRVFKHCTSMPVRSKDRNFSRDNLMRFELGVISSVSPVFKKNRSQRSSSPKLTPPLLA